MVDRGILDSGLDRTASPFKAVGAPGFAIYGGYIVENEKDKRLAGREKYTTYSNQLANTAIIAAGVRFFLSIVSKAQWSVDPADDTPEAEEIAERVRLAMKRMTTPWHRVVRRAAMSRFYGFSVSEWTAIRDEEGWIRFSDIEPRPQLTIERWDVDRSGTVVGILQRDPQTQAEIYLPRGKCICVVDDTLNDSPEGLGLFRHVAKVAARLERYEILEGWGYERDLRGTPIGRGPLAELMRLQDAGQLTPEQVTELRAPIERWITNALKGKDTALFLDSSVYRGTGEQQTPVASARQWDVALLQGDGGPHSEIAAAIERCNREIARILGVEHLLLGSDSAGSFAMSQDKSKNFALLVDSTLIELRASFEKDFLGPLFELNGWDERLKPEFKIEQVQHRDLEVLTSALADLAQAGAPLTPDDPAINSIRELAGLPDAPEFDISLPLEPIAPPEEEVLEVPEEEKPDDV